MQLQPRTFTLQQLNTSQYQYSTETQKQSKSKYLQIYYKSNPEQSIIKLIQHIFSDQYLYKHIEFQQLLLKDKKGYVDLGEILKQTIIVNFVDENKFIVQNNKISQLINKLSTKLICNHNRIRRRQPFINKIQNCTPVYIQQYPQNDGNQQLQTLLSNSTTIYYIKYNHFQNWALVYSSNPNSIIQLNGHFWSTKSHFRVLNYQKARQSFKNIFYYNEDDVILDKYKKNKFKSVMDENNKKYKYDRRKKIINQQDQIDNIDRNINRINYNYIENDQMQLDMFRQQQHYYQYKQLKSNINKQLMLPNLQFNIKYLSNLYLINSNIMNINDQMSSNKNIMQLQ